MDPTTVTEAGGTFLSWFDDYGALKILAMIGIFNIISMPVVAWFVFKKLVALAKELAEPLMTLAKFVKDAEVHHGP